MPYVEIGKRTERPGENDLKVTMLFTHPTEKNLETGEPLTHEFVFAASKAATDEQIDEQAKASYALWEATGSPYRTPESLEQAMERCKALEAAAKAAEAEA